MYPQGHREKVGPGSHDLLSTFDSWLTGGSLKHNIAKDSIHTDRTRINTRRKREANNKQTWEGGREDTMSFGTMIQI